MALDNKNPLVRAMAAFKKGFQPSRKKVIKIEFEVKQFETLGNQILTNKIKNLSDFNFQLCIGGNMERVADYAKHEPDNKTKFKRFNVESELKGITGVPFLEDFETMITRIETSCASNPEQAKGHIAHMCAEYSKFCQEFEQIKKLVLSQKSIVSDQETLAIIENQLARINAKKEAVDKKYASFIAKMQPAHKKLYTEVSSYFFRDDRAKQEEAAIEAARNSALNKNN